MILIIILLVICFSVAGYVRNLNYDARFNYGREIAEFMDLNDVFERAYLGKFGFDEAIPNESLRKDIESKFDKGVESRLALHFAKTLPKWILKAAAQDIKSGQFGTEGAYSSPLEKQVEVFAEYRSLQLSDLLKAKADSAPDPNVRRRRRR